MKHAKTKRTPDEKQLSKIWSGMMKRCYNKNADNYRWYGGSGVVVCEEWKKDNNIFIDWSLKNGYKEGLQLDKDKLGNGKIYSPETCQWITKHENTSYKRNTFKIEYNGEILNLKQLSEKINIPYKVMHARINTSGMTIENAINMKYTPNCKKY